MSTIALANQPNTYRDILLKPYEDGLVNIKSAWHGKVDLGSQTTLSIIERIERLVIGIFLLIPVFNSLLFIALKTFDSRFITKTEEILTKPIRPLYVPGSSNANEINPYHLATALLDFKNIPGTQHNEIDFEKIYGLISNIDFAQEQEENSFSLNEIYNDQGQSICGDINELNKVILERFQANIEKIKKRQLSGVANAVKAECYYQTLEKLLALTFSNIHSHTTSFEADQKKMVIDLACATNDELGRYLAGVIEHSSSYVKSFGNDKDRIRLFFMVKRTQIFYQIIEENEGPDWQKKPGARHVLYQYTHALGKDTAIPHSNLSYKYPETRAIDKQKLLNRFNELYTFDTCVSWAQEEDSYGKEEFHRKLIHFINENIPQEFIDAKTPEIVADNTNKYNQAKQQQDEAKEKEKLIYQWINTLPQKPKELAQELTQILSDTLEVDALTEQEQEDLAKKYDIKNYDIKNREDLTAYDLYRSAKKILEGKADHELFQSHNLNGDELKIFKEKILQYNTSHTVAKKRLPEEKLSRWHLHDNLAKLYGEEFLWIKKDPSDEENYERKMNPKIVGNALIQLKILLPPKNDA